MSLISLIMTAHDNLLVSTSMSALAPTAEFLLRPPLWRLLLESNQRKFHSTLLKSLCKPTWDIYKSEQNLCVSYDMNMSWLLTIPLEGSAIALVSLWMPRIITGSSSKSVLVSTNSAPTRPLPEHHLKWYLPWVSLPWQLLMDSDHDSGYFPCWPRHRKVKNEGAGKNSKALCKCSKFRLDKTNHQMNNIA